MSVKVTTQGPGAPRNDGCRFLKDVFWAHKSIFSFRAPGPGGCWSG